jgi:hypothetical protein
MIGREVLHVGELLCVETGSEKKHAREEAAEVHVIS